MNNEKLNEIVRRHKLWLECSSDGGLADLRGADLRRADLRGAYLCEADLRGANLCGAVLSRVDLCGAYLCEADLRGAYLCEAGLRGANLCGADLSRVDLSKADLRRADLRGASLCGSNLRGANLCGADLSKADLRGADLREADLRSAWLPDFQIPQEGELIVWKKLVGGVVAKLLVPAEAERTASLVGRNCRAEYVKVLELLSPEPGVYITEGISRHDRSCVYRAGEFVAPDQYDNDIRVACTHGIHFFLTQEEADVY